MCVLYDEGFASRGVVSCGGGGGVGGGVVEDESGEEEEVVSFSVFVFACSVVRLSLGASFEFGGGGG